MHPATRCLPLGLALLVACDGLEPTASAERLEIARFTEDERLERPDITEWVFMGTNFGLGYTDEAFQLESSGFHIVHMEPAAYDHLRRHGAYADGTMFSLAVYDAEVKNEPELDGVSQGELVMFEIHLIDRERLAEGRAFYFFEPGAETGVAIPAPNACLECHHEHAAFDGTFTQFYPPLRTVGLDRAEAAASDLEGDDG